MNIIPLQIIPHPSIPWVKILRSEWVQNGEVKGLEATFCETELQSPFAIVDLMENFSRLLDKMATEDTSREAPIHRTGPP